MTDNAILAILRASGDVTESVGSGGSARIYLGLSKRDAAMPYICFEDSGSEEPRTMEGAGGMTRTEYQITCWAATREASKALADKAKAALDGYRGTAGGATIERIQYQAGSNRPFIDDENEAATAYGRSLTFTVWSK